MAETPAWLSEYPEVKTDSWLDQYEEVKEKPFLDISDTASALGRAVTSLPTTVSSSFSQAWEGLANPWKRGEGYLKRQEAMKALQEEMRLADEEAAASGDISSVSSTIREAIPSLGFSGATLAPSIAAYGGTLALTKSPTAAAGASAATSGLLAYRMAGAQFLDDARDRINTFFQENLGRLPDEREQAEAYAELLPLARKFGAAEAGPEALGNLALGGAGKYIRRALGGKNGVMQLASDALGKVTGAKAALAGTGAVLSEIGTEAVTGVEQERVQKQFEEGVMRGVAPEEVSMQPRSASDYAESFKEVAPTTLALTGMMGAAGLAPTAISRGVNAFRKPSELQSEFDQRIQQEFGNQPEITEPTPEIQVASDALNATANVPFTDISGQAAAATVAQNAELSMQPAIQSLQTAEETAPEVTPSPEMEMPEKPSQTITGSNVQTGTEMPVPDNKIAAATEVTAPPPVAMSISIADSPSPNLAPRATENVEPKPTRNAGESRNDFITRREAWEEQYGNMRKGGRTHNDDGTPYQPTVFDEVMPKILAARSQMTDDEANERIGEWSEARIATHVRTLLNAGWIWDAENQRWQQPEDNPIPNEKPIDAVIRLQGETPKVTPSTTPKVAKAAPAPAPKQSAAEKALGLPAGTLTPSTPLTSPEMGMPEKPVQPVAGEAPLVTPEEESLAAQRRADLLAAAADAAKGKTKAQVSPVVTAMVTPQQPTPQENAVQEQITDEGVLRQERPEMELQGMGEQNVQPQETATEGQIQEEVIAAPGESEQGTLYGKPSELTDKDRGQAVSLAKTLQPGDVVETNDGQETFRYKVVVENGTRSLRKIDQRGDIIEGVREKFLANPARTSSQGELAAIPDGRDTIDVIARGRIIRSGTEAQPTIQVATERETDEERFQRIKSMSPSQRTDEDIAFANAFSKRQKELKPQAGEATRKAFLANHTASIGGRLRKALDQTITFRGLKGTVGSWIENLYNEGWRMALDARGNRQFTNGTEALGSSGLGKVGMNYADFLSSQPQTTKAATETDIETGAPKTEQSLVTQLNAANSRDEAKAILANATLQQVKEAAQEMGYPATGSKKAIASRLVAAVGSRADAKAIRQQSPQTTQAAAETQTPESLRVDSGAAGVVQSEPSRGSILEVEKESAKTAIESTEKSLANLSAESLIDKLDAINNLPHKRDKVASMLRDELRRFPQKKVAEIAKLLGTKANVDAVVVNIMLESRFVEKGMDAVDPELRRQRDEEEEERREAAMSYARLHDKERSSNIVTGKVTMADARQAAGLLQNNGISPNAAFTWMGTVDDLLALKNTPFGESHKKLIEQVAANKNIEGTYSNGTAFVFVDQVVVSNLDRRRAKELGISEGVAAAMRVIDHENGHFGMDILSAGEKARIMAFLRTQFTPESLDALAYSRYPSLRKWRTNPESEMRLLDERLRQYIEETKTIPTDGVWKQFWDYIKAIWRKWTGKPQGEPTLQSMKDVVRLIRKALKDAHKQRPDQTKGGDRVLMSYAGEKAIENLPKERRQFMRDSLDAAKAMAAAGKSSEEIRAATGWFPGKYDGKLRFEIVDDKAAYREKIGAYTKVKNWLYGKLSDETMEGTMVGIPLRQILDFPELYDAYPQIKKIKVDLEDRNGAAFIPESNTIALSLDDTPAKRLSYLLHELQHWIQTHEGFAKGGSPKGFGFISKQAFDEYQRIAGEIEARDVQARKDLTPEQRKAVAPYSSENIAQEDAIVLFGGGPQMSVSGISQFVPAVNLNGRIETGTSHYEAWLKHAIRQIPSYKKDGLSDSEVKDLADRWLVDHPEAMANSMTKEGFVTDEGYLNRQDSLKKFLALGGKQRLDPGEVRDWLDSSDIEDARFSISYASETSQASSLGQQTAREMTASPRKLEAIIGVRQAYESMPKVHGNAVSLAELFDAAAKIVPNLTQVEFNSVVQGMYEDNAALLDNAETPSSIVILPNGAMMSVAGGANDAEYLAAVEAGDMEKAQRMVDEAAKAAGYSDGPLWHRTWSKFTEFIPGGVGSKLQTWFSNSGKQRTKVGPSGRAIFLSYDREKTPAFHQQKKTGESFIRGFAQMKNPLVIDDDTRDFAIDVFADGFKDFPLIVTEEARASLERAGHDSVHLYYNGRTSADGKPDEVILLNPSQIKSADPVTFDDNGNVIPLSQRFQTASPDIRFSIASTPEQQSAAAKFKSAITAAAQGLPDLREYEGRRVKDKEGEEIEVEPHNVLWFNGFMNASEQLIADLQKEGLSLDEIYSKVTNPQFQQELGLFSPEAGQGQAAVVLAGNIMQRTLNASRKAKTKADKLKQDALHLKAAEFYYGLGTKAGQNLLLFQLLQNDPRTRFIFMENRALADMLKKADHGVNLRFDGAYGATQEATDTNVNASATAATKNIADQAEEAEEDDQDAIDLAAGEATLKDPEKSLYEEYKDLLREEGILARLDREEAETGAKMSISPERRSELAGLTKEERAKLREKNKQRRMEILSKLLGREEDAKTPEQKATRKKREKMAQTAQKRAQKGKEIEVTPTSLGKIINQARRDIKGPTGKPIQWREIFRQPAKSVEEFRKNILLAIMGNDAFKDMDDAQKRQIADMFAEAWGKEREKVLNQLQKRHEDNLEAQGKREAAKALREARNQILEIANLGVFSNDELTRILGEKFGFKTSFTEAEQQKLSELAEKIQDESLSKPVRNKLAREFLATLQSGTQISIAELLSNWWVASVLSGGNTITAIALSFTNGTGIGILGTHVSRAIRDMVKGDTAGAIEAITSMFKAYAKHIASFPSAANRAWNYLWTGDVSLLEASANDPFKNVRSLADIARYQIVADQVAKDPNKVKAVMGRFMQFMGRLLSALDAFNVMITKAGTTSLAIRQSGLTADQIRDAELKNDLKFYKDKIIREDPYFNGKAPTSSFDKAYLASLAEAALYKDLAEFGVKMENADYLAAEAAMTMTPTGVGGIVYNKIKALDKDITTESRERLKQAEKAWAAEKDIDTGLKLFTWRALNFLAEQGINALGLRFARFAGNKFNQSLSYIPVLGALRVFETGNKELAGREEAFKDTIIRNQTIGFIMIIAGMKIIEAIADEPDDKKRGWFINGGWNNLTPDQKKQRLSLGEKQYTIGIGDQVFNYQNWPIGQAIAAIGELSDMIRFSPEKWKEKTTVGKFGSSLVSGMTSALEIPALTQVGEIFGNTMAAKDPSEQTISRLSRVMAGWAGGFMPRFLKDIDYMLKPEMRKYESFYEKAASHIPIYRSYVGKEYYDILGNQIKKNAIPGSRDFDRLAQEPEYKMLGSLNARGIWLTPANAEYRMIGKGRYRRRLTQEEADRYSLETGKLYKQMIMRFGPRALQMPVEQAKDYISAKADDMRDLALLKAVRN